MKKLNAVFAVLMVALISQGCSNNNSSTSSSGTRIVLTIKCDMVIAGLVGNAGLALNGRQISTTTAFNGAGDAWATAEVIDDAAQTTGSSIYASAELGSANPSVLINDDYFGSANGGYFDISADRNNQGVSVIYTDTSLGVESPVTLNFANTNCTATNF